ncbi:DUF799 domain-containing protein [Uliginosibacterium gangwonense]|uniref:DUF799 domain-containing protein n=1 Tax=Uliginosibacterium gangwonense TaxID=392736 RepID=UPI00039FD1C2|nr:DUF799 domain-containing protein [Uliginosibacterium gangwonense]
MKRLRRLGVCVAAIALLSACATKPVEVDYSAYKQSRPRSILIMPPANLSPDVAAGYSVMSVSTLPLAESGYYVMPVTLTSETFKQNGITVAEDAQALSIAKLREIFGADAALYMSVTKYGTSYRVLDSVVEVRLSAKLVDLRTGGTLWQGSSFASSAENSNNNGGLIGMLVSAAVNQIVHNLADHGHDMADRASVRLLYAGRAGGLLYGPYSPKYGTD